MDYNFYNSIIMNLADIKGYINSYLLYTFKQDKNLNIAEINDYILSIPNICDNLKEMIDTLYEKENS